MDKPRLILKTVVILFLLINSKLAFSQTNLPIDSIVIKQKLFLKSLNKFKGTAINGAFFKKHPEIKTSTQIPKAQQLPVLISDIR